jgi:hypothetical protein
MAWMSMQPVATFSSRTTDCSASVSSVAVSYSRTTPRPERHTCAKKVEKATAAEGEAQGRAEAKGPGADVEEAADAGADADADVSADAGADAGTYAHAVASDKDSKAEGSRALMMRCQQQQGKGWQGIRLPLCTTSSPSTCSTHADVRHRMQRRSSAMRCVRRFLSRRAKTSSARSNGAAPAAVRRDGRCIGVGHGRPPREWRSTSHRKRRCAQEV